MSMKLATFLLLLTALYGGWRLWPRTMPTYRAATVRAPLTEWKTMDYGVERHWQENVITPNWPAINLVGTGRDSECLIYNGTAMNIVQENGRAVRCSVAIAVPGRQP